MQVDWTVHTSTTKRRSMSLAPPPKNINEISQDWTCNHIFDVGSWFQQPEVVYYQLKWLWSVASRLKSLNSSPTVVGLLLSRLSLGSCSKEVPGYKAWHLMWTLVFRNTHNPYKAQEALSPGATLTQKLHAGRWKDLLDSRYNGRGKFRYHKDAFEAS